MFQSTPAVVLATVFGGWIDEKGEGAPPASAAMRVVTRLV